MTLFPTARGQYDYAEWLNDGGNILWVGDSISLALGPAIVGGRANIDGIGSGIGSVGGAYATAAWSNVTGSTSTYLSGFNLFNQMGITTMANGTSPNQVAWNSQIIGSITSGHFWAGSGGHLHWAEMLSLDQAWLKDTMSAGATVWRVPIYMGPDGVTTNDVRITYRTPDLNIYASSAYFNTYRASDQVVWVDMVVPTLSLPDGYAVGVFLEYRANTATRSGEKVKYFSSQITKRQTPRSNGIVFMSSGIGGANSADFSNQGNAARNVSSDCINALLDGVQATHFVGMIGQNGSADLATYKSQMTTMLAGIDPDVKKILVSSFGTVANTGGEVGSTVWCQGADELANSRTDLLHLNVQRLAPDASKLFYSKYAAYTSNANGIPIRMGNLFTDSGNTYLAKFYGTKTGSTPALNNTGSWANIGALANTQTIGFDGSTDMYLGDGTHPSYPKGMEAYRAGIQNAHIIATSLIGTSNNEDIAAIKAALTPAGFAELISSLIYTDEAGNSVAPIATVKP